MEPFCEVEVGPNIRRIEAPEPLVRRQVWGRFIIALTVEVFNGMLFIIKFFGRGSGRKIVGVGELNRLADWYGWYGWWLADWLDWSAHWLEWSAHWLDSFMSVG